MRLSLLLLALASLLMPASSFAACKSTTGCPVVAATGVQACGDESTRILERASRNRLYANGPTVSKIGSGCPNPQSVDPSVPCVLTKAIAWTESTWTQFCAPTCGDSGTTVISFDCGYGVMQITSGMRGGAGFDPLRVAADTQYNVGTGIKILCDKWRATPCVGANKPEVIEDWYFATWAYNGFSWVNNPNNMSFPAGRPPYNGPGSLSRGNYPYQEIVWGFMRNPPGSPRKWTAVDVSYPKASEICNTDSCKQSANISDPTPTHGDSCQTAAPRDDAALEGEAPPNPIVADPGKPVQKTWKLRNTGDTIWSKSGGYSLVRTSTDQLGGPQTVDLPDGVNFFGEDVATFTVTFMPQQPGPNTATFELRKSGNKIGPTLTAVVNVTTSTDADGDGHGRINAGGDDCNDDDPTVFPGAQEICDGKDNDCDTVKDDGLTRTCSSACGLGQEVCLSGSFKNCSAPQPAQETCNGVDDDCNGVVDDGELCGDGQSCVNGSCAKLVVPAVEDDKGCGCSSASGALPLLAFAVAGLARRRRR